MISVPAPLQIFLCWCLLLPSLCGIGFAVARVLPGPPELLEFSFAFWLGVTATCAILVAWHLFFPIDGYVWAVLGPIAAAGLLLELRRRRGTLAIRLRERWVLALFLAAFAFRLAARAALPLSFPDDQLYHTQTVRWSALYPAIPGIGNLNPFLAFNNAYHLLVPAFGVGPLASQGHHVANGLLLLTVVAACASGLVRLLDPRTKPTAADFMAAFLLGPALDFSDSSALSSPAADLAVHMSGTALLLAGLRPVLEGVSMGARRLAAVLTACAGAVILKQSLVCIALPLSAFAAIHWMVSQRPRASELRRMLLFMVSAALLIVAPWVVHSVILSGYPLYPSPFAAVEVPWRMDRTVVVAMYDWVHAFARWPGHFDAEVVEKGWMARWFQREWLNNRAFLLPAALAVASAVTMGAALLAGRRPLRSLLAALAPLAAGIAMWWSLAPDTRFAGPLLWAFAGLLALAAASAWQPALTGRLRVAAAAGALAVAAGAFIGGWPHFVWQNEFPPARHNKDVEKVRIESGEVVDVSRLECWDPPCAIAPLDRRLRLRKPGDWSSGFTLQPP